ncbi:hypothetical protein PCANC_06627 [Puccinia coronata f. sp. avenae]|uniref:Uncharacterized protein n=1 Tax=Puccinia coronata f. sp. avenae TaxID=200324 RepID=A0A2N5T027_9BASI|nr:hypothetical protein PCANC_06627 [Puccinia coronata f. sp. avenae]
MAKPSKTVGFKNVDPIADIREFHKTDTPNGLKLEEHEGAALDDHGEVTKPEIKSDSSSDLNPEEHDDLKSHADDSDSETDDPPSPSSKGPLQRTGSLTKSVPKNYVINLFFARLQRLTIEKLSSLVSKINFTPRLRGINVMLGRAWSRLRSALSKTDEVAAVSEPGPGAFGIGIKKQTYLYEPLAEHGNLDLEIDLYFRNPHLEMIKNFKYSFVSRGIQNHMKQELQRVFGDFGLTLQSQAKAEKSLQPEIEQLGTFLQKSLTNKYDSSSDAMKNLAERLSAYKSERLLKDQESIASYLPEEQRYLSRLVVSNDPAEFVKQVGVIQKQLAKMVEYKQDAELATAMGSSWQKFPDSSVQEIRRLEDQMIANFGGRENIKSVLHHIEQSDIHKGFMREMNDPASENGALIQMIEPWGYLWKYQKIPHKQLPYKEFGMKEDGQSLKKLKEKLSPFAHDVIKTRLRDAASVRAAEMRAEDKLNEIMTPQGIQDFASSLQKSYQLNHS